MTNKNKVCLLWNILYFVFVFFHIFLFGIGHQAARMILDNWEHGFHQFIVLTVDSVYDGAPFVGEYELFGCFVINMTIF